jgi:hypothetical protein
VEVTPRVTKVDLLFRNAGGDSIDVPIWGNAQLVLADGSALRGRVGQDHISVPPGDVPVERTAVFDGTPGPAATGATLTFSTVFGTFDLRSITVRGIDIRASASA